MRRIRIIIMMALTVALLFLLSAVVPAGAGRPVHHASGGGFLVVPTTKPPVEDNDIMFAFNARQLNDDGDAIGQFEQHNLTKGGIIHLEIFYMEVDGNDVCLIGEVTKSINTGAVLEEERAVRLQDNGEGRNAPLDFRSRLYKDDAGCFEFPILPLDGGNIQIR